MIWDVETGRLLKLKLRRLGGRATSLLQAFATCIRQNLILAAQRDQRAQLGIAQVEPTP
jgi:hypothetical protein